MENARAKLGTEDTDGILRSVTSQIEVSFQPPTTNFDAFLDTKTEHSTLVTYLGISHRQHSSSCYPISN